MYRFPESLKDFVNHTLKLFIFLIILFLLQDHGNQKGEEKDTTILLYLFEMGERMREDRMLSNMSYLHN